MGKQEVRNPRKRPADSVQEDDHDDDGYEEFERLGNGNGTRKFRFVDDESAWKRQLPVLAADGKTFTRKSADLQGGNAGMPTRTIVKSKPNARHPAVTQENAKQAQMISKQTLKPERIYSDVDTANRIAKIATMVTAEPEKHVKMIEELCHIYMSSKNTLRTRKLAILTEMQLYCDITPGYSIRPLTEAETTQKVSKDVAQVRNFEQGLLASYKRSLERIKVLAKKIDAKVFKKSKKKGKKTQRTEQAEDTEKLEDQSEHPSSSDDASLAITAFHSLCTWLSTLSHFNESQSLAAFLVKYLDHRNELVREKISQALSDIMSNAHLVSGQSLQTIIMSVKTIADLASKRGSSLRPSTIRPLLSLKLHALQSLDLDSDRKQLRDIKGRRSKKDFKKQESANLDAELERDLEELEAKATPEEQAAAKRQILTHCSLTYFRILSAVAIEKYQSDKESRTPNPPCLELVLEGIGMIASLINPDVLHDLIDALNPLFEARDLRIHVALECLQAAYLANQTMIQTEISNAEMDDGGARSSVPTEAAASAASFLAAFDVRSLDIRLYDTLLRMIEESCDVETTELFLRTLSIAFDRRKVPVSRRAAFARRLMQLALLTSDHSTAISVLGAAFASLPDRSWPERVLEEEDVVVQDFLTGLDDPDASQAINSFPYELDALAHHWHPKVQLLANSKLKAKPCHLIKDASKLLSGHDSRSGGFNPAPSPLFPGTASSKPMNKRK